MYLPSSGPEVTIQYKFSEGELMTRNTKYQTAILTLMILLGLAACNSSKNSDSSYEYQFKTEQLNVKQGPADYDACALVTKADAEAVLGEPLDRGKGDTTTPPGAKACAYGATTPTSMALVLIYLGLLSMGAGSNKWEAQKKPLPD